MRALSSRPFYPCDGRRVSLVVFNRRVQVHGRPRPQGPCTYAGWEEAGLTDRVINSMTPRMVRKVFFMYYLSSKIPLMMLDIHRRRDAAALGAQRHGGSPTPPAILALGQLIGLMTRQERPDKTGILVRDRDRRAVVAAALDQLPYPWASSVRFASYPA